MSRRTRGNTVLLGVMAAVLGLLSPVRAGAGPAPAAAPASFESAPAEDPVQVAGYWTPARVDAAKPLAESADGGAATQQAQEPEHPTTAWPGSNRRLPASAIGRLLMRTAQGDSYATATVVQSEGRNLIVTSAQGLYDKQAGDWNSRFWFVPGYRDGSQPFGGWAFAKAVVSNDWFQAEGTRPRRSDVGMVVLATNEAGKHVEDVTGAHQIAFDAGDEQTITAMGYPAVGFDGRRLASCTGSGSSYSPLIVPMLTVGCYFGGMSGGPFLAGLGTGGTGTLVAVYYGAGPDFTRSYGAYFDEQERAVFEAVRRDGPVDAYVPIGGRTMFDTGIQIQNLDTVRDAHVNVEWVDNPGDEPAKRQFEIVPKGGSITVYDQDPDGFSGGVCIVPSGISVSQLKVTANHFDPAKGTSSASSGFTTLDGAQRVLLPLLMKHHHGTSTWVAIQNLEPRKVRVTALIRDKNGNLLLPPTPDGVAPRPDSFNIQPGQTHVMDQSVRGCLPAGVFSGELTADGDIAATVVEHSGVNMLEYRGFPVTGAATRLALPLVMGNNYGGYTGVQVQNLNATDKSAVRVVYSANTATEEPGQPSPCRFDSGNGTPTVRTYEIPAGSSITVLQRGGGTAEDDPQFRGCRYIGSATLNAGFSIVAVVNQIVGTSASAYEATPSGTAGPKLELPLIQGNNDKSSSGIQIQNLDDISGATVTVTYGRNAAEDHGPDPCPQPTAHDVTVPAGGSLTLLYGNNDKALAWSRNCPYVGSVTLEAKGDGRLTALVNQLLNNGSSDHLSTYVGG